MKAYAGAEGRKRGNKGDKGETGDTAGSTTGAGRRFGWIGIQVAHEPSTKRLETLDLDLAEFIDQQFTQAKAQGRPLAIVMAGDHGISYGTEYYQPSIHAKVRDESEERRVFACFVWGGGKVWIL